MRYTPTIAALGVLALLAACGGSSERERDAGIVIPGIDGRNTILRPGMDPNAAYTQAIEMKTQGNCAGAITKLRPVANLGPGYENAQTALGSCLLQEDSKDLSSDYLEGLTWLRRAADGGWPEAQGALAMAHSVGPQAIRNGDEAAYWLALYQDNPAKMRVGFTPLPAEALVAVEKTLTPAEKEAAAKRAAAWQRKVWLPPTQQATGIDTERGPRGRQQRRQPPTN